ncbi:MAG TPA: thioesterase family protein [Bacteroidales bacterium]|nr:thioesterase family protein [Bacteroidales bacterium]
MEKEPVFYHQTPIQIRFNDVDIMGHVNNSVYQNYFDYARLQYFEQVLGYRMDWYDKALVLVKIEIEYLKPVQMYDQVRVFTRVYHLGNKSLRMEQRLVGEKEDDVRCRNYAVLSGFSYPEGRAVELQEKWRQAIVEYENI